MASGLKSGVMEAYSRLFEQQTNLVEHAAEEACLRYVGKYMQRIGAQNVTVERQRHAAYLRALGERRDARLTILGNRAYLVGLATRHGHPDRGVGTQPDRFDLAFPHARGHHGPLVVVQLHGVEILETPVQQLETVFSAG